MTIAELYKWAKGHYNETTNEDATNYEIRLADDEFSSSPDLNDCQYDDNKRELWL